MHEKWHCMSYAVGKEERNKMICLINGKRHPEHYFWNCLHSLATERQMQRILEGKKLIIGESEYQMIPDEEK